MEKISRTDLAQKLRSVT